MTNKQGKPSTFEESDKDLVKGLLEADYTLDQIATKWECSHGTVGRFIAKMGLGRYVRQGRRPLE
jgi:hypothetical protein